ncbi:MAG: hypothetical protein WCG42_02355 [Parachlamydiaceae bacterium]
MSTPVNNNGVQGSSGARLPGAASSFDLQSYIELVYVQTANATMVNQMASLQSSLGYTQSAMDALTRVQNLKNAIKIHPKGAFPSLAGIHSVSDYYKAASAYFGTPVQISALFGSGGPAAFIKQMASVKALLSGIVPQLSAVTPVLSGGVANSNSLLAHIKVILNDIKNTGAATTTAGATKWLTDNYSAAATSAVISAGLYQQNITNAITAGQSLNTTQAESVRNYLYIYEEYYKSASAVLQQMTQIIQKMADGINH